MRALEADDGDEVTLELARLERGEQRFLRLEDARRRLDDVAALEAAVDDEVAAVLVEPVQGFAGARDCSPDFLAAARRVCS